MVKIKAKILYFVLVLSIPWLSPSSAYIRHCDPNTDKDRETLFLSYPLMKEFLENDPLTNGRLGTVKFVNWQDKLFHLKAHKGVTCRWRMKSPAKSEMEKFNDRTYMGTELNAEPLSLKNYYRLVACENSNCVQYFHVFLRPMVHPDFPVQIYTGYQRTISCSLKIMDDTKTEKIDEVANHNPPFRFEWTGPADCPEKNWQAAHSAPACVRYFSPDSLNTNAPDPCDTPKGCEFNLDNKYKIPNYNFPAKYGYKDTSVSIHGKSITPLGSNTPVQTEYDSKLEIKSASDEHNGKWRCIAYDKFGVASHPDKAGQESLDHQEILHRGIIHVRVKDLKTALGIPLAITFVIILWSILCIACCKQCTDYDETNDAEDEEAPKEGAGASNLNSGQSIQDGLQIVVTSDSKITKMGPKTLMNTLSSTATNRSNVSSQKADTTNASGMEQISSLLSDTESMNDSVAGLNRGKVHAQKRMGHKPKKKLLTPNTAAVKK